MKILKRTQRVKLGQDNQPNYIPTLHQRVTMAITALYTDLSRYYDLMCTDINYQEQSHYAYRIHQLFGNQGKNHLDLACGTGLHVQHFLDFGYTSIGLDINQPMLNIAQERCPKAKFIQQDMSHFVVEKQVDFISCFLYSIHYNNGLSKLKECIACINTALKPGGVFFFNAVDKNYIDNREGIKHALTHDEADFTFQSAWRYCGEGDKQTLHVVIQRATSTHTETWQDEHPMVAISFHDLKELLLPYFEVFIFEHDFNKIIPWGETTGNAIFVAVKT